MKTEIIRKFLVNFCNVILLKIWFSILELKLCSVEDNQADVTTAEHEPNITPYIILPRIAPVYNAIPIQR